MTAGPAQPRRFAVSLVVALMVGTLAASPARAWDPATTHAGLTERALMASTSFHRVLSRQLGRALGALEPLALHSSQLGAAERKTLWARLNALDPSAGYRPDADGVASALAWVTAGAVLAETPPERGRNHFYDPSDGRGLDNGGGLAGTWHSIRLAFDDGGSLRGLATGTAFDLTGQPSLNWVQSPQNDQGLGAFHDGLVRAVAAAEPAEREAGLVRALIALGGMLAALEDAGEPAHVRNDFRRAFLEKEGPSGWDRASRFERFVADRYGRNVPAPAQPRTVARPNLAAFFTASDGGGLADRTQRRFFSDGTVPDPVAVDASTTPQEVMDSARASLRYPQPALARLELRKPPLQKYMMLEGRRALGYERSPHHVTFFLDDAVYADTAKTLLPEVAAYGAGLTDHLFRGQFSIALEGRKATVTLAGTTGAGAQGTMKLVGEDSSGRRKELAVPGGAQRAFANGTLFTIDVPEGITRVAVVLRGTDDAGELVALGEAPVR